MIAVILLSMVQAATPAAGTVSAAPQSGSAQAAFDAATGAYEAKQWTDAVRLFDALEARLGSKASKNIRATIDLRRGIALKRTNNVARAEPMLRGAVAAIAPDDTALGAERFGAVLDLGSIALQRSDFETAVAMTALAKAAARTPGDRLEAAILGLRSTMFDGGDAAFAHADEAQKLVAERPETTRKGVADIDTWRARLLLNRGRPAEAHALLKRAVARQGGLDTRVSLAEVVTRSDLAIAALLNKDVDSAREYLAYTGAGRIAQSPFGRAAAMDPPPCGEAGVAPDDSAIVEFGIRPDGAISYAQTVYMSRPSRAGAKAFSDAVLGWTWQPASLDRIPDFYRVLTRVELRCANAVARPGFTQAFDAARDAYLASFAPRLPMIGQSPAALPAMRAELDRRKMVPGDPLIAPLMLGIARNVATAGEERRRMIASALALLPADAPIRVRAAVEFDNGFYISRGAEAERRTNRLLLARADIAADAVSAAIMRLAIARRIYRSPPPADAEALIRGIVDDKRLEPDHPLRTAALIQLANFQSRAQQADAAATTFAQTGLTADQCALLDTPPAVMRSNVDGGDFPMEAQRWGFEGWTRIEQDISADGRARGTRVVIAYPPFVFGTASTAIASNIRYEPTFRPGSTTGCIGSQQTINFRIAK